MTILEVQQLGKAYRQYTSEWQRILNWFGNHFKPAVENWVLQDVSFQIQPGDAVGIIGQNGAGKSTLLKLITGTQFPTTGRVLVNGRVSAILELGMGFNQDLSGRENVLHTAGLMGFSHAMVLGKMAEIEAFAEIGRYFDEPVRTYSSGMQVRVAFAVATAFRPDILIVDEALSVGDAYFQHKSFNRIREFQRKGTTLLLVSHDHNAICAICNRALLFERGRLVKDGNPSSVVDFYNALIAEKEADHTIQQELTDDGRVRTISGTGEATVVDICLFNKQGRRVELVGIGEVVTLQIKVLVHTGVPDLVIGYMIKDRLGQSMFGTNTYFLERSLINVDSGKLITYCFEFPVYLGCGNYSVTTALHSQANHIGNNYEWRDLAFVFEVVNLGQRHFEGCIWLEPVINVEVE